MANVSEVFSTSMKLHDLTKNMENVREDGEICEGLKGSSTNPFIITNSAQSFEIFLTWLYHDEEM